MNSHGITSLDNAHATTIVAVHKDGKAAMAGDGQVSVGQTIMKHSAKKVRFMADGRVLAGFSGSVADAFTLFDKFEAKLDQYKHSLPRAAMEFAKEWRSDKYLRRLEALLMVSDKEHLLVISGGGEVIEPDNMVAGIGSGGGYALAAARAMLEHTDMSAEDIARQAISIAADICVYTNHHITVETIA